MIGFNKISDITHLKILRHGGTSLIGQGTGSLVAYPGMDTTTSGIKPRHVGEAEILLKSFIHDLDGHLHVSPASAANLGPGATTATHVIVIRQVNIKDKFALDRFECILGQSLVIFGIM